MQRLTLLVLSVVLLLVTAALAGAAERPLQPYSGVLLNRFTVDEDLLKTTNFPGGYEDVLQKTLLARLLTDDIFTQVVDGTGGSSAASFTGKTVIMDGEVTDFSKGNRAARVAIGYGAGSAKMKLVLVFRDMDTHQEVLRLEQTGRYAGFGNLTGGSAEKARTESARKVVEGLLKKIKAAR